MVFCRYIPESIVTCPGFLIPWIRISDHKPIPHLYFVINAIYDKEIKSSQVIWRHHGVITSKGRGFFPTCVVASDCLFVCLDCSAICSTIVAVQMLQCIDQ